MRKLARSMATLGALAALLLAFRAAAATPAEIATSIDRGVEWLISQQRPDGSWGDYEPVAHTAFAVVKLEERAFELGYPSPFDTAYPASSNVVAGLNYLFANAATYGPGKGTCFAIGGHETYSTGLTMMAIAASRTPGGLVDVPGSLRNGWTYLQVLQDCVDYFTVAQNPDGGWIYNASWPPSDNSNTGYAVLGLRYAEAAAYGFNCVIPPKVKLGDGMPGGMIGQEGWIGLIQDPVNGDTNDGGSHYVPGGGWVNLLKTGNLLFEMSFVGDSTAKQRVQDALDYIQRHWNDPDNDPGWRPNHFQSMYCLMKGLASLGIDTITVGGSPVDWYAEFATAIVASQQPDGSWPPDYWGDSLLSTAWALLVLEKVAPPPPVEVKVTAPDCACDKDGYPVSVTYTVERLPVNGTMTLSRDGAVVTTLILTNFMGTGTYNLTVGSDIPGTHGWLAVLDATGPGGVKAHGEAKAVVKVCESPVVSGIPDQTAPFTPFDLDNYLKYSGGGPVIWSVMGVPPDWKVVIDTNNVVTVKPPPWPSPPTNLTFVASVGCCGKVVCRGSDTAQFTPNRPPDCSKATPSVAILWPPNNKFTAVSVLGVTDPDGDPVTVTIDKIFQDEPVDTFGDGNFTPDGSGIGTPLALLRAERSGTAKVPGNGRVYHVYATATDGRGGSCWCEVRVGVPHDVKDTPVDEGPKYNSTALAP